MRRRDAAAGVVAFAALLAPFGWFAAFSGFEPYDDEGYLLVSLRGIVSGQHLYDQVFSQYGPLYYEVFGGLFSLLRIPVDHDHGRLVTLALWLATSALGGWSVASATRRWWLGAGVQVVAFSDLRALVNEPLHPSTLTCLLLIALAATSVLVRSAPRASLLAGVLVAGLALVKINVGVFAGVALAFAMAQSWQGRAGPLLRRAAAVLLIALPVVLMSRNLLQPWAAEYAGLVGLSAISLLLAARPSAELVRGRDLGLAIGVAVLVVVLALVVVILLGTSPAGLAHGWLIQPLSQAAALTVALPVAAPFPLLALAWALLALRWRRQGVEVNRLRAAKLAAGMGLLLAVAVSPLLALLVGPPLAWVAMATADGRGVSFGRSLLAAGAVTESLQAYPVAGGQIAYSALLLVPVAALCIADGLQLLDTRRWRLAGGGAAIATAGLVALRLVMAGFTYAADDSLDLPGAWWIRVPHSQAAELRGVSALLHQRCSTFISLPGLDSFYLFTGERPPSLLPSNDWMYILDGRSQQHVVSGLTKDQGLCVMRNQRLLAERFALGRPLPDLPLARFVTDDQLSPVGRVDDFEVLSQPGVVSGVTASPRRA